MALNTAEMIQVFLFLASQRSLVESLRINQLYTLDLPFVAPFSSYLRAKACRLRRLTTTRTWASPEAVTEFVSALADCRTLEALQLNELNTDATATAALWEGLAHVQSLTELALTRIAFQPQLGGCLKALLLLPHLRTLRLVTCPESAIPVILQAGQSLKELTLSEINFSEPVVSLLLQSLPPQLTHLDLGVNDFTCTRPEEWSYFLQRMQNLSSLNLSSTHLKQDCLDAIATGIGSCSKLESLVIDRLIYLTGDHLVKILSLAPRLRLLDASHASFSGAAEPFIAFGAHSSLETLHLRACNLTESNALSLVRELQKTKTLTYLGVSGNKKIAPALEDMISAIKQCPTLQRINIGACAVSPVVVDSLTELITMRREKPMLAIGLSQNPLGDEGILKLCQGLVDPRCTLQVLQLADVGRKAEGTRLLNDVIQRNQTLRFLCTTEIPAFNSRTMDFGLTKPVLPLDPEPLSLIPLRSVRRSLTVVDGLRAGEASWLLHSIDLVDPR